MQPHLVLLIIPITQLGDGTSATLEILKIIAILHVFILIYEVNKPIICNEDEKWVMWEWKWII